MSASSFDLDMGLDDAERDEPGEATVYAAAPAPCGGAATAGGPHGGARRHAR
ncbi:MAG: hypothetical protein R3E53_14130 [Myxococcota bacterium]